MASKAVNHPTDPKVKQADVAKKLQFYGIYSAFALGKVPSNEQIDVALNSALESAALNSPDAALSEEGKGLIADVKNVIEQAKILLLSKNEGNLLQEFIWETQQISGADATLPNAPVDKETAKKHGNDVLNGLRTLGTLVITNGQFRKLLKDASILLRSIAGDAASNAAGYVQPSEDQLSQIDAPADDNTWHDTPDTGKYKSQAKGLIPFGKKEIKDAAAEGTAAAHPNGSTDPKDVANFAAQHVQQGGSSGVDAASGAKAAVQTLKNKSDTGETGSKIKGKAKEVNKKTQNYLKGKMPRERREQTLWRLKKMVVEIQGHADYQEAIETLLRLAEEYTGHTKALASNSHGAVKGVHNDSSVQKVETNLKVFIDVYGKSLPALTLCKTLLERFANGTSSDDFFDALNQVYRDAENDDELSGWFNRVNKYIRDCLQKQGYIIEDTAQDEFNYLYDQGKHLLRTKYRQHTDRVLDEVKFFGSQFDEDPLNHTFADSVRRLFADIGYDENGKTTFKPHLLKDVTDVILPKILESVHYLPLPRIEYSDPTVDLIIENLIIESDNLVPNLLTFHSDNFFKMGRKGVSSERKNKIALAVSGVQMDLRDVSFYIRKKAGFPSIKDQGLCDIFMGGEGFSFSIKMETADAKSSTHFFTVSDVKVKVKNLNVKLKQSSYKLLFTIAKPLLLHILRPAIQKALQAAIKQKASELDNIMFEISQKAQQAKLDAENNPDPENIKNIYQHYWQSANSRLLKAKDKKAKVEESMATKKFNMAMTKGDSIFPAIDLPSGISTQATKYKDLATKADTPPWKSAVFSIGSAKQSTNLPAAPAVTRKHHCKPAASLYESYEFQKASNSPAIGQASSSFSPGPVVGISTNGNGIGSYNTEKPGSALQGGVSIAGVQATAPPVFSPNTVV